MRRDVVHEVRIGESGLFIYRFMGRNITKRDMDRRVSFWPTFHPIECIASLLKPWSHRFPKFCTLFYGLISVVKPNRVKVDLYANGEKSRKGFRLD